MARNPAFVDYLNREFLKYQNKKGRRVSQAEWAMSDDGLAGVDTVSLSQWMKGSRHPTGANVHHLAERLGPRVYDLLGLPRLMPKDPLFAIIADRWFEVDEATRQRVIQILTEGVENTLEPTTE